MTLLHELLGDRDWQELPLEEDDLVLDVLVIARVVRASEVGEGKSSTLVMPEEGLDPIVMSGLLHNAVLVYETGGLDEF